MDARDRACLRQAEKCRRADEARYGKTRQGAFELSVKPALVHPDGRPMEVSDGGRAMDRMIRSLDWAYHQARRERCVRDLAVRGEDLLALGYRGPALGAALDALVEAVVFDGLENKKEALLDFLAGR